MSLYYDGILTQFIEVSLSWVVMAPRTQLYQKHVTKKKKKRKERNTSHCTIYLSVSLPRLGAFRVDFTEVITSLNINHNGLCKSDKGF